MMADQVKALYHRSSDHAQSSTQWLNKNLSAMFDDCRVPHCSLDCSDSFHKFYLRTARNKIKPNLLRNGDGKPRVLHDSRVALLKAIRFIFDDGLLPEAEVLIIDRMARAEHDPWNRNHIQVDRQV
jgi:hypothetical protein